MVANIELQRVNEWSGLRGFANLFRKELRTWWGTRRWWINVLLWTVLLCGLPAYVLFVPGLELATEAEIARAGGLIDVLLPMALDFFCNVGASVLAIGSVILAQDLVISEKQSGVTEWVLSKPIARRAYILAKLATSMSSILIVMVGLPSTMIYSMLSLRMGALFPLLPFLSAIGILTLHTLFYLTLILMLGTIFNNRVPILGIGLGSILGGSMLGGFIKPLLYVTPWMLPKIASLTAAGRAIPTDMGITPLAVTALWSLVFILVALWKFAKTEF